MSNDLFVNTTETYQLLDPTSCHVITVINRIRSGNSNFDKRLNELES